ncbi:MAG TPA: hypothetical protein VMT46_00140 [Anaerolineaceae bacterium]|nr:hypothetical protein [Anaerolineaceae bacterium]
MAKKPIKKNPKKEVNEKPAAKDEVSSSKKSLNDPWISMRTGLIWVGIASLGMAILTAWEVVPERGLVEGILWGLLFGGIIWVIFWGFYFLRRFLR